MDTLWIETVSSMDVKISFQEELDVYSDNELNNHSAIMPVVLSELRLRTVEGAPFQNGEECCETFQERTGFVVRVVSRRSQPIGDRAQTS